MSAEPKSEGASELKILFFQELAAGYRTALAAHQILAQHPGDAKSWEELRTFFHRIAGTASSANQQVLGHLAALCEDVIRLSISKNELPPESSMKLISEGLAAVATVLQNQDSTPAKPALRPPAISALEAVQGSERLLAKILIIDDDLYSARLTDSCLKNAGFSSSFCCDPKQAMLVIQGELPDLVILDVEMPGLDGFGLCRYIRSHPALQLTPIIFLARNAQVDDRVKGLEAGGNDYVAKPFEPNELIARVRSHLSRLSDLRKRANRDGLTNCYNHTYFKARVEQELIRARRHREPVSLGLIDVDHFKDINEKYGHSAGDLVLINLAGLIESSVRNTDVVARYGGEEFAVLLIQAELVEANGVMHRIHHNVTERPFSVPAHANSSEVVDLSVGASIGVAHFEPADDLQRLLTRADHALYEAKQRGRNRVFISEGPPL